MGWVRPALEAQEEANAKGVVPPVRIFYSPLLNALYWGVSLKVRHACVRLPPRRIDGARAHLPHLLGCLVTPSCTKSRVGGVVHRSLMTGERGVPLAVCVALRVCVRARAQDMQRADKDHPFLGKSRLALSLQRGTMCCLEVCASVLLALRGGALPWHSNEHQEGEEDEAHTRARVTRT